MAKTFYTSGTGNQQTTNKINDEKIPVYDTKAAATADLANLAEGQIIATKDGTADTQLLKDYVANSTVRKFNYTMTGTDNVYNDIKALCNQLIALGVNTYAGSFLRTARTYGHYNITVTQSSGTILLNGTVVVDNEQGRTNSYAVSRVNNDWYIMPTMLNNNILATDCNFVVNPGIYSITNVTTNTPYTGCYGILETKGYGTDIPSISAQWIYQEVLDTSGRKFVRHCINPNTMNPISSQWSPWEEEDVLTQDIIVAPPASQIVGYLSQIKYFLSNADWSRINSGAIGYRREFVGSMELQSYWYGTYNLSYFGNNYKIMNGTIYGEGNPVRFSAWYDINYPTGWRVSLSYNYTFVDISGQTYIGNLNEQLSTALNLVAPQTWDIQHCDCNIEVLGYFYAIGTFDMRGTYASFSGTILSSEPSVNGQTFTAEFETTRNYWKCHNIILKQTGSATIDGNSNVYLGAIMGTNDCEIVSVRCTDHDIPVIPAKNMADLWYAKATNWDGSSAVGTAVTLEIKFRLL